MKINEKTAKAYGLIALYIVIGVVVALILFKGFGVLNNLLTAFGLQDSEAEKKAQQDKQKAIEDNVKQSAQTSKKVGGKIYTKTAEQWKPFADSLYTCFTGGLFGFTQTTDALDILSKPITDYDMSLLIQAFGTRQDTTFGQKFGAELSLPEFVRREINIDEIDWLNSMYKKSGMTFKF